MKENAAVVGEREKYGQKREGIYVGMENVSGNKCSSVLFCYAHNSLPLLQSVKLCSSVIIISSSIKSVQSINCTNKAKKVGGRYWDKEAP